MGNPDAGTGYFTLFHDKIIHAENRTCTTDNLSTAATARSPRFARDDKEKGVSDDNEAAVIAESPTSPVITRSTATRQSQLFPAVIASPASSGVAIYPLPQTTRSPRSARDDKKRGARDDNERGARDDREKGVRDDKEEDHGSKMRRKRNKSSLSPFFKVSTARYSLTSA